jgi:hypothetical protein
MTIPYNMGFHQGHRGNPFLGSFFETSKEYLLYQQGYHAGQDEAQREIAQHKETYETVL